MTAPYRVGLTVNVAPAGPETLTVGLPVAGTVRLPEPPAATASDLGATPNPPEVPHDFPPRPTAAHARSMAARWRVDPGKSNFALASEAPRASQKVALSVRADHAPKKIRVASSSPIAGTRTSQSSCESFGPEQR